MTCNYTAFSQDGMGNEHVWMKKWMDKILISDSSKCIVIL